MIIAIDGPAGSGKSTVAKLVAVSLGFHYLDTGAMYRAIAWRALESGVELDDASGIADVAQSSRITFAHEQGEALPSRVFVDDADVTEAIRAPRIDDAVSTVAKYPAVRAAMVEVQRDIGRTSDIVVEGRDIGTVVFPDAAVKVFLTASAEERARRRAVQQGDSGLAVDTADVLKAIEKRDEADSSREVAPLVAAHDAVSLDTTGLTIEQVVARIAALAHEVRR